MTLRKHAIWDLKMRKKFGFCNPRSLRNREANMQLTIVEKRDLELFEAKFRIMLREKDPNFVSFQQMLAFVRLQIKEKNYEKMVLNVIKKIIKEKETSYTHKFTALLFLKELMEMRDQKLIMYNSHKLLKRLEKLAGASPRQSFFNKNLNEAEERKAEKDFQTLLLECFAHWREIGSGYDVAYKEAYERLRNKGLMQGIDQTKPVFYNKPEPDLLSLRERLLFQLLKEKVNLTEIKQIIEEFDSYFLKLDSKNKNDINFFVNVKELFSHPTLDTQNLHSFLSEWAQSEPNAQKRVNAFLHQNEPKKERKSKMCGDKSRSVANSDEKIRRSNTNSYSINHQFSMSPIQTLPSMQSPVNEPQKYTHSPEHPKSEKFKHFSVAQLESAKLDKEAKKPLKSFSDDSGPYSESMFLTEENQYLQAQVEEKEREKRHLTQQNPQAYKNIFTINKNSRLSTFDGTSAVSEALKNIFIEKVKNVETLKEKVEGLEKAMKGVDEYGNKKEDREKEETYNFKTAFMKDRSKHKKLAVTGHSFVDQMNSQIDKMLYGKKDRGFPNL